MSILYALSPIWLIVSGFLNSTENFEKLPNMSNHSKQNYFQKELAFLQLREIMKLSKT